MGGIRRREAVVEAVVETMVEIVAAVAAVIVCQDHPFFFILYI